MCHFYKDTLILISKNKIFSLYIIFIASFFLRLYHLAYHDFWYDEVYTAFYSQSYFFWEESFYNVLLHFWVRIFGYSEFSLRFPSVIFNFSSVILIFFLGRELFNKKTGIFASIFMGLSPFQLWYAQEARVYSMALFLGTVSSYLFYKAITRKQLWLWLSFMLVSILGLYTNYFYVFLFIAQSLCFIVFSVKYRFDPKGIACFLIIIICFSFSLGAFFFSFFYFLEGCWIPMPTWKSLIITLENFMLGYNGLPITYLISDILLGFFLVSALWVIRREKINTGLIFCLFLLVIPLLLAFVFSKAFFSVYLDRGLIIFTPYFYLILSLGMDALKKNTKILSLSILISVFFLSDYRYFKDYISPLSHHIGVHLKRPIKPVIEFLKENLEPQDIIAVTSESMVPALKFYIKKQSNPVYFLFAPEVNSSLTQKPMSKSKFLTQRPIEEVNFCLPFYKIDRLRFRSLWVISSNWERDGQLDENSEEIKERLDSKLKLDFANRLNDLWIFRYSRF